MVVIGAGPAGLSAANRISPEAKVLVCEMQASLGTQFSSVWLPSEHLPSELERAVVQRVKRVRFEAHGMQAEVDYPGVILDWKWLVRHLALRARKKGVELWTSSPVKELLVKRNRVEGVKLEGGTWREEVRCQVVIDASGCSGVWSGLLLKHLGLELKPEQAVYSAHHVLAGVEPFDWVSFRFDPYLVPLGVGWVHPFTEGFAVAGVQGLRMDPETSLEEFVSRIRQLRGAAPVSSSRALFPDVNQRIFCSDGALAVGGAGWQVLSISRGSLLVALRSGELAGEVALDAITEGDVSQDFLSKYKSRWLEEMGAAFERERQLYQFLARSWERKTHELIQLVDGDRSAGRLLAKLLAGADVEEAAVKLQHKLG